MIKQINTRIAHKHDLEVNWLNNPDFVPLLGELIIYDSEVDSKGNILALPSNRTVPYTYVRLKVGDGQTLVNDLPYFAGDYNDLVNAPVLPKYVSDLEDDLGIATTEYIELVKKQIPTLLSQLENDSNYVTDTDLQAVRDSIPDTTNLADKEYVDSMVSKIPQFEIMVVETLPTEDISNTVVYLLKPAAEDTDNLYDEYIYVNNTWELLGSARLDLDNYAKIENIPTKVSQLENDSNFTSEEQVEALFQRLASDTVLRFYCIEDVTIILNGASTTYPANSNVEVKILNTDVFEIVPTSDNSIMALNGWPGALGTYYSWLEGVKQFSNILFDMNAEDMYSKWSQGNQGAYQVQYAQYLNCIFWSDNPYISDVAKRTNYTLYYSAQLPLCYSTIPDNTFKAFYLAFNVNSDPNWGNKVYRDSFAKATWATQVFSYYGARTVGVFGHDDPDFNITLPKDCRGLFCEATAVENAGTFDAINVTNFGAKSGSWRDAFRMCNSLRQLYIKNLKVNLNVSWSPLDYSSIYFIISTAANTNKITISVSPYTYNLLSPSDFELAASKNIVIELLTTNYVEDRRLGEIANKADKATTIAGYGITDAYSKTEVDTIANSKADVDHIHSYNDLEDQPFVEATIENILLPETTVNITDENYINLSNSFQQLIAGKTYCVLFNGVEYTCEAREHDGSCILIGNGEIYGDGIISNGEPFCCDIYDSGDIYLNVATAGEYTISIYEPPYSCYKIDEKYASVLDWNELNNKPFGEEYGNVYYLEEQTFNLEETDDLNQAWIDIPLNDLVYVGNKYTVVFDGVEYEATLYEEEGGAFIGINYYYPSDNRDSLPFGLWFNEFASIDGELYGLSKLAAICTTDEAGEHTVSVYAEGIGTKKIDKKYLPAELSNVSEDVRILKDDIHNLNDNLLYKTEKLDESVSNKMDKVNPVGSGSLSFNRKAGSGAVIGDYATILGNCNEEQWRSGFVTGEFSKEYIKYKDVYDEHVNTSILYQKSVSYYRSSEFSFDENTGMYTLINPVLVSASEVSSSSEGDYFVADTYEKLVPETISSTVLIGVLKNYEYNGSIYTTSFSNHNTNNFKMVRIHRHKSLKFNDGSVRGRYVHTVGNGTLNAHSNAHTLDWDGNAWYSGDVYVGSTSGTNIDEGSKKLATEEFVLANGSSNKHVVLTIPAGRMRGDIDGDGVITTVDVDILNNHINGSAVITDEIQLLCADVNGDGSINTSDISVLNAVARGTQKYGRLTDVTNTWTVNPNYDTEEAQFYTDILIENLTSTSDAIITIDNNITNARFVKAECVDGAIRIYATRVPISELTCFVNYMSGSGKVTIIDTKAGTVETSAIILRSSTPGSNKKFRLTIDDDGVISTEEVTD